MTGYESKRAAAQDKLDDDDTQVYQDHDDALTIAYQSGFYDGKKAAQTKQEPVAWMNKTGTDAVFREEDTSIPNWTDYYTVPLYTAPPQRPWVGLTDEERSEAWRGVIKYAPSEIRIKDLAQAIESKLKEKNT